MKIPNLIKTLFSVFIIVSRTFAPPELLRFTEDPTYETASTIYMNIEQQVLRDSQRFLAKPSTKFLEYLQEMHLTNITRECILGQEFKIVRRQNGLLVQDLLLIKCGKSLGFTTTHETAEFYLQGSELKESVTRYWLEDECFPNEKSQWTATISRHAKAYWGAAYSGSLAEYPGFYADAAGPHFVWFDRAIPYEPDVYQLNDLKDWALKDFMELYGARFYSYADLITNHFINFPRPEDMNPKAWHMKILPFQMALHFFSKTPEIEKIRETNMVQIRRNVLRRCISGEVNPDTEKIELGLICAFNSCYLVLNDDGCLDHIGLGDRVPESILQLLYSPLDPIQPEPEQSP